MAAMIGTLVIFLGGAGVVAHAATYGSSFSRRRARPSAQARSL